jgi:hypothetical protein
MAEGESHKHHFIPAFYLHGWAVTKSELLQWSKPHNKVVFKPRHPNATGYQENLNSFPGFSRDVREWLETIFFGKIDMEASEVLPLLLRREQLSPSQTRIWARFLVALRFRHRDILTEMRTAMDRVCREHYSDLNEDETSRLQLSLLRKALINEEIVQKVETMYFSILDVSAAPDPLLTSDWPLQFGLGADPPELTLPLNPTNLFVASSDARYLARVCLRSDKTKIVTAINDFVVSEARCYVFSSDMSQEQLIRSRMSQNMEPAPLIPALTKEHMGM